MSSLSIRCLTRRFSLLLWPRSAALRLPPLLGGDRVKSTKADSTKSSTTLLWFLEEGSSTLGASIDATEIDSGNPPAAAPVLEEKADDDEDDFRFTAADGNGPWEEGSSIVVAESLADGLLLLLL